MKNPKGSILCFVGPPGVGKTSLGMSIAKATGRKFVRMSLGGVRDEAEIRGHRRTYIGALPGQIIQSMKKAGTKNPVFMLDEVDKMASDFRGDPASALLEVLDPEQNTTFQDHYLDVEYDLSQVLFVATANVLHTIPGPLQDRMEILRLHGYTELEKLEIAKQYLVKKQREGTGLSEKNIYLHRRCASRDHPQLHARGRRAQPGARDRQRLPQGGAPRGEERRQAQGRASPRRTSPNSSAWRSSATRRCTRRARSAWSPAWHGPRWAAASSQTEVQVLDGKGKLTLTGQLGDVMQESAQAALTYIRSRAQHLGLPRDFYRNVDIHVHVPEGAIPKDGPSAGITMATALASALTKIPVRRDIAMTGEITLRGKVLPIGGLKEKLLAAHRAGIFEAILPEGKRKGRRRAAR